MGNATVDLSKLKRVEKSEDNTVSKTVDLSKLKRVASERKEGEGYLPSELPADVPGTPAAEQYKKDNDPYFGKNPLPTPTEAMYDDKDKTYASRMYQKYQEALDNEDPRAKLDSVGRLTYDGVIVPSVDGQFSEMGRQSGPTGRVVNTVLGEAQDGLKETATVVLGLGDALNSLLGIKSKGAQVVYEAFGNHKQEGVVDNIVGVLTQALMGSVGAKKGLEPLAVNVRNVSNTVARSLLNASPETIKVLARNEKELTKFTQYLLQETGAATTMSPDGDGFGLIDYPIAVVDNFLSNGAIGLPADLAFDEKGTFNQKLFRGKIELIAENLLAGAGVLAAMKTAGKVSDITKTTFIDPLQIFFSDAAREKGQAKRILQRLTDSDQIDPETIAMIREYADDNRTLFIEPSDGARKAVGEFEVKQNTMDAIARGAMKKNEELSKELAELREVASKTGDPKITKKISEIELKIQKNEYIIDNAMSTGIAFERTRALPETGIQDTAAVSGIDDYAKKTSDDLAGYNDRNINEARDESLLASREKEAAEKEAVNQFAESGRLEIDAKILDALQNDPTLREQFSEVNAKALNDIDYGSLTRGSQKEIAVEARKAEQIFKAEMDAKYEKARKLGSKISLSNSPSWEASLDILEETSPRAFKKIFPDGNVPQTLGEMDEYLKKARIIEQAELRGSDSQKAVSNLIDTMNGRVMDEVASTNQLAGEAQTALMDAKRFAKESYYDLFGVDGPVGNPRTNKFRDNMGTAETAVSMEEGINSIQSIFRDKTRQLMPALIKQLEVTGRQDLVASSMKYSFLEDINLQAIQKGGLANVDVESMRNVLKELPFTGEEKKGIMEFLDKFDVIKNDQKAFNETLAQMEKDAIASLEKIKVLELNTFLTKEGDILKGVSSSDVIKDLILGSANNAKGAFESLVQIAGNVNSSNNELAKQGLMSAWFRAFREQIAGSGQKPSLAELQKLIEPSSSFMETGKTVMKSNPEVLDLVKEIISQVNKIEIPKAKLAPTVKAEKGISTELNLAQKAINRIITATMGPLSRAGAKTRAVSGGVLENMSPEEQSLVYLDRLFSDPKLFSEVAKLVTNDMGPKGLSPEMSKFVYEFFTRGLLGTGQTLSEGYYPGIDVGAGHPSGGTAKTTTDEESRFLESSK